MCKTRAVIGLELSSIRVQTDEWRHEWRENTRGRPAPTNPLHRRLKTDKTFHQTGNIPWEFQCWSINMNFKSAVQAWLELVVEERKPEKADLVAPPPHKIFDLRLW